MGSPSIFEISECWQFHNLGNMLPKYQMDVTIGIASSHLFALQMLNFHWDIDMGYSLFILQIGHEYIITCGIKERNSAHETYMVYPTLCNLHKDFSRSHVL